MSFNQIIAVVVLALTAGTPTPASAECLTDNRQIISLLDGKRIYLATPVGGGFPLNFKSGGCDSKGDAAGIDGAQLTQT